MWTGIGEKGVFSILPEPQPIPLLTLSPVLCLHMWFILLGLPHAEPRVNSSVNSFKLASVGFTHVSPVSSLTLLSYGRGTVDRRQCLLEILGCEQPAVSPPACPRLPHTTTTQAAARRNPTPVLWPTSQRKGSSQEAGTTDSPDLLQVSIFKQGGTERSRNEAAGAHTAGKADLAVVLVS